MPRLPSWKQKAKKHTGKRFGSRLASGVKKKRNVEETLTEDSLEQRVRFLSDSELSDQTRKVICVSVEEDSYGPALSAPELVSIVAIRSPAKLCAEEREGSAAFRELQELLDDPAPSRSKSGFSKSPSKVEMSAKGTKKSGSGSRIWDQRMYSYDEIIECQEKLNDSDDFQFNIDDVEQEF